MKFLQPLIALNAAICAALVCLCAVGCQSLSSDSQRFARSLKAQARPGLTRDQVMDRFGIPNAMSMRTPPGTGPESWEYIVPGMVCRMEFGADGRLTAWHTDTRSALGVDHSGLGEDVVAPNPRAIEDIAQELRLLRMEGSLQREELPAGLRPYWNSDLTPDNAFSPEIAAQISQELMSQRIRQLGSNRTDNSGRDRQ